LPPDNPLLKQSGIVALHELEATVEIRFDPTINVLQTLRKHASSFPRTIVHGAGISVLEFLNHHEEHVITHRLLFLVKAIESF
jgi:hypothetical protein